MADTQKQEVDEIETLYQHIEIESRKYPSKEKEIFKRFVKAYVDRKVKISVEKAIDKTLGYKETDTYKELHGYAVPGISIDEDSE